MFCYEYSKIFVRERQLFPTIKKIRNKHKVLIHSYLMMNDSKAQCLECCSVRMWNVENRERKNKKRLTYFVQCCYRDCYKQRSLSESGRKTLYEKVYKWIRTHETLIETIMEGILWKIMLTPTIYQAHNARMLIVKLRWHGEEDREQSWLLDCRTSKLRIHCFRKDFSKDSLNTCKCFKTFWTSSIKFANTFWIQTPWHFQSADCCCNCARKSA